jgi:hypothetical protein
MLLVIYWRENRKDSDFTPKLYCYYTNDNASKTLTWVSLMSCLLQFFTHIAFKNSKHLHKKTSTTSLSLGQTWYLEFRANNFCSLNHTFCLSKNKISWLSRVTQPMGYVGGTCLVWQMVLEASRMVTCLIFCVRWTQESRATKIFMFVKLDWCTSVHWTWRREESSQAFESQGTKWPTSSNGQETQENMQTQDTFQLTILSQHTNAWRKNHHR